VLAGLILVSVGVVGLYVGRIFDQVKDRPLFLIDARAEGPESLEESVPALSSASAGAPAAQGATGAEGRGQTPSPDPRES
jgi:hypothetical protein